MNTDYKNYPGKTYEKKKKALYEMKVDKNH